MKRQPSECAHCGLETESPFECAAKEGEPFLPFCSHRCLDRFQDFQRMLRKQREEFSEIEEREKLQRDALQQIHAVLYPVIEGTGDLQVSAQGLVDRVREQQRTLDDVFSDDGTFIAIERTELNETYAEWWRSRWREWENWSAKYIKNPELALLGSSERRNRLDSLLEKHGIRPVE